MKNHITIITPCYNESPGIALFLKRLESALKNEWDHVFNIVVVDDCSTDSGIEILEEFNFELPHMHLHVISNKFNVGHQGSIFHGILYTAQLEQDFIIIMDSDGEDNPEAIPLLLQKKGYDIVEVKRGKRSENFIFRMLYFFYKLLFWTITGRTMNYGNFCMLGNNVVNKIRYTSFIHLPAYLLKYNGSRTFISYDRSPRIKGKSHMGYKKLFMHAFKSFVEFGEDMLLWLLRIFGIVSLFIIAILTNIFYQKFIVHTAIPGWFSTLFIGLLNLAMLCLGFFVLGILIIHQTHHRKQKPETLFIQLNSKPKRH